METIFSLRAMLRSTQEFPARKGRCGVKLRQPPRCCVAADTKLDSSARCFGPSLITAVQHQHADEPAGTTLVQQVWGKTSQAAEPVLTAVKRSRGGWLFAGSAGGDSLVRWQIWISTWMTEAELPPHSPGPWGSQGRGAAEQQRLQLLPCTNICLS